VVLAGGFGWHWLEMREQTKLTHELDALAREHAPTQTMLKQVVDMRQQLKELQQQEVVANELETQRNALTLLGVVSSAAKKTGGRLRVTKMELTNFQNASKGPAPGAGPLPGGMLLSGVSLDNQIVTDLSASLKDAGIFSHVDLVKLKQQEANHSPLHDFEIRCDF
jgi:hypothetical protein